ncbi:MAG TPA: radical SAM family heme chaperone HemW [Thermoanaerobaculia bacterium]|nr:radical SAM family heme chaperone HemW [Thermoanaerobaculia bacterium]
MTAGAGLYVHLPFCRSRCGYCAFVVTTDDSVREAYLSALERESGIAGGEAHGCSFDTVYLGGGTPSWLPPEGIARLLDALRRDFAVETDAEITLEANPDDVSSERVASWKAAGATRVSLGVQSFQDRELAAIGRRHDAADAARALDLLLRSDLRVSGDLILGLPEQTAESFRESAARLAGSGALHVSVYLLEAEKSRTIEEDRSRHPDRYLGDDAQADLWLDLSEMLGRRGFQHYEISNWCREGEAARHNLKYWTRQPTLGLGVSAHELWEERRRANVSAIPAYLAALGENRRPTALDQPLGPDEQARERIVLGLRLSEGVDAREVDEWVGTKGDDLLATDYARWEEANWIARTTDRVRLTERGFLVSNEILCRFI